jgi:hypothetical protein
MTCKYCEFGASEDDDHGCTVCFGTGDILNPQEEGYFCVGPSIPRAKIDHLNRILMGAAKKAGERISGKRDRIFFEIRQDSIVESFKKIIWKK